MEKKRGKWKGEEREMEKEDLSRRQVVQMSQQKRVSTRSLAIGSDADGIERASSMCSSFAFAARVVDGER